MVELIEILEKRKDGDSDEYYFTVSYKGNKYKVMFKDWWFGNRNSGCSYEKVWDSQGKEIEIGFKTYRSKQGADGKTSNTMQYSKDMRDCFEKGEKP